METLNKEKLYAVYSEKQSKLAGIVKYASPSGIPVYATDISKQKGCPLNMWDDKEDLGEVTRFISRVTPREKR